MSLSFGVTPTLLADFRYDQWTDASTTPARSGDRVQRAGLQIPTGSKYFEQSDADTTKRPFCYAGNEIGMGTGLEFASNSITAGAVSFMPAGSLGMGGTIGTRSTTLLIVGSINQRAQDGSTGADLDGICLQCNAWTTNVAQGIGIRGQELVQYVGGVSTAVERIESGMYWPQNMAVVGYRADTTNVTFVVNNKRTSAAVGASLGSATSLCLGSGYLFSNPWIGKVQLVVGWASALTDAQLAAAVQEIQREFALPQTQKTAIFWIGDSNTAGMGQQAGTYASDYTAWTRKIDAAIDGGGGHEGYSCSYFGNTANQFNTNFTAYVGDAMASCPNMDKICVIWTGGPDLTASVSAATILGYIQSIVQKCRAAGARYVIVCTIPPRVGTAGQETERNTLNTSIRAGSTGADAYADVDAKFPATVGYATPKDNLFLIDDDQKHLYATGHNLAAQAVLPVIQAATHVDSRGTLRFGVANVPFSASGRRGTGF